MVHDRRGTGCRREHNRSLRPLYLLLGAAAAVKTGSWDGGARACTARLGHPAGLSPSRVSRNPWKGAQEWNSVPSVWSWFGMPGICLWQCFWGNRLCLCQREKTMFQGNHCSLLGQIHAPSPICPGRVPRPPSVPAAGASPRGGQATGGAPLGRVMVNLHSPQGGSQAAPAPSPVAGAASACTCSSRALCWVVRGLGGSAEGSEGSAKKTLHLGGRDSGQPPIVFGRMLEGKAKGKDTPVLKMCSLSYPGCGKGQQAGARAWSPAKRPRASWMTTPVSLLPAHRASPPSCAACREAPSLRLCCFLWAPSHVHGCFLWLPLNSTSSLARPFSSRGPLVWPN